MSFMEFTPFKQKYLLRQIMREDTSTRLAIDNVLLELRLIKEMQLV